MEIVNQIYLDKKMAMVYRPNLSEPLAVGDEVLIAGHVRKVTDIDIRKTWAHVTWS